VNADDTAAEQPPTCGQQREHDWMTFTCGRGGAHVDRKRRACWVGDAPATDLQGRPLLRGTVKPPKLDPRAFRRRRAAARGDRPTSNGDPR
jgi:hypothetical protein